MNNSAKLLSLLFLSALFCLGCDGGSDKDDSSSCDYVPEESTCGDDNTTGEAEECEVVEDVDSKDTDEEVTIAEDDSEEKDTGIDIPNVLISPAALRMVDNCAEAWGDLKAQFVRAMDDKLEQEKEKVLSGSYCWRGGINELAGLMADDATYSDADADADVAQEGSDEASEYSTTNNQVAGVEEADFIKNDGSHIYILAQGSFQIVKAWPAADAKRISVTSIEGEPKKLFVKGDRALVYSSLGALDQSQNGSLMFSSGSNDECTHGYDCDFVGDGKKLKMTLLDISDKDAPAVLRETFFDGSYINSRMIGDAVYTVVVFPELVFDLVGVTFIPWQLQGNGSTYCVDTSDYSTEELDAMFEQLRERNQAIVEQSDLKEFLPKVLDIRHDAEEPVYDSALLSECKGFHLSQTGDGSSMLSLVSFKIDQMDPYQATTIVGRPGAVYASADSLYIAQRQYRQRVAINWFFPGDQGVDEASTIHKFALDHEVASTEYLGSGYVKGRALNQFSMDEKDGYLRIATSNGRVPSENVHSTVSILQEKEGELVTVGKVDNIAPKEDIRSARFDGNRGFLVTFKKTDPLFVLDLEDPTAPTIKGELKIPGFSTYMHMMDDDHILSIGYDAEEAGSFAWFQGIQLQILDVSNLEKPSLLHKEVIGTRGSTSEAATNHLAFNYFKGKLAIPMVICEESPGGGSYGDIVTFSGLLVYDVSTENGFDKLGGVPHAEPDNTKNPMYWGSGCGNWWTNSNSVVQRSIFMEDFVYSVDMALINISSLADLENPVSSVDLTE